MYYNTYYETDDYTKKKVTLMLESDVYEGIRRTVGDRQIGSYLSRLARPHVIQEDQVASYRALAADNTQATAVKDLATHTEPLDAPNVWQ